MLRALIVLTLLIGIVRPAFADDFKQLELWPNCYYRETTRTAKGKVSRSTRMTAVQGLVRRDGPKFTVMLGDDFQVELTDTVTGIPQTAIANGQPYLHAETATFPKPKQLNQQILQVTSSQLILLSKDTLPTGFSRTKITICPEDPGFLATLMRKLNLRAPPTAPNSAPAAARAK